MKNITILNHSIIPIEIYKKTELLCQDFGISDTTFVAVSDFMKGILWTGELILLAVSGILIIVFVTYIPTKSKLMNDLDLSFADKQILDDPNNEIK